MEEKDSFIRRHRVLLMVGGVIVLVGVGFCTYMRIYQRAFMQGAIVGFNETIRWFDDTLPDVHLGEIYKSYAEAHAEELVDVSKYFK